MGKKLCNIVGIILQMMRESIGKTKIRLEVLNRGKLFLLHHRRNYYFALTCRSNDVVNTSSFVAPRDYQFSCSDTPTYTFLRRRRRQKADQLHRVLDRQVEAAASPLALPGFGRSPAVRQLRVSDSPYSMKDDDGEEGQQVDEDAEEFIRKFYKDLKKQKRIAAAAMGSPSPYRLWA